MRLRDIAWNIVGLGTPAVVAALTIPAVIDLLTLERFGLLTLVWGAVSFSGLFDLGIGRATTQVIARARSVDRADEVGAVVGTALRLSFLFGSLGTLAIASLILLRAHEYLRFNPTLLDEVTASAFVLALIVPIQTVSATLRGINEAFERFRGISLVRILVGSSTFLGPYATAQFTQSLVAATLALLFSRALSLFLYGLLARRCIVENQRIDQRGWLGAYCADHAKGLMKFGGWITVTGIVYPIMMQSDRFIIGSKISSEAVAGYTIPYELVMQLLTVVGAVTTVAFPRLSALHIARAAEAVHLLKRIILIGTITMAIAAVSLGYFLDDLLRLWLSRDIGTTSVAVGRILCVGLVPYTIGTLLVSYIHARGRADITGKAHLFQAPIYLFALNLAVGEYGEIGAAWSWTARVAIDTVVIALWSRLSSDESQRSRGDAR